MDERLLDKFMDMIKNDIWGLSFRKEEGENKTTLSFKYDKEKNIIVYEKEVLFNKQLSSTSGAFDSKDDVLTLLEENSFISEAIQCIEQRIEKEGRFNALKSSMMEQIESMGLNEEQKEIMFAIIDKTTQLSERVGMGNRVYLVSTSDYWEHVRVTDNSRWSDTGENLHLQLVQAMEDPEGVKHHNYPNITFGELVARILDSPLVSKNITNNKSNKK